MYDIYDIHISMFGIVCVNSFTIYSIFHLQCKFQDVWCKFVIQMTSRENPLFWGSCGTRVMPSCCRSRIKKCLGSKPLQKVSKQIIIELARILEQWHWHLFADLIDEMELWD